MRIFESKYKHLYIKGDNDFCVELLIGVNQKTNEITKYDVIQFYGLDLTIQTFIDNINNLGGVDNLSKQNLKQFIKDFDNLEIQINNLPTTMYTIIIRKYMYGSRFNPILNVILAPDFKNNTWKVIDNQYNYIENEPFNFLNKKETKMIIKAINNWIKDIKVSADDFKKSAWLPKTKLMLDKELNDKMNEYLYDVVK